MVFEFLLDCYPQNFCSFFPLDPVCQLLRVQFEPAFYGIDGDPFNNCQDGDALNIWDNKKKKASLISICGANRPKPLRIFNKNREKIFQWRSVPGYGGQDGFQAYITVKGCDADPRISGNKLNV